MAQDKTLSQGEGLGHGKRRSPYYGKPDLVVGIQTTGGLGRMPMAAFIDGKRLLLERIESTSRITLPTIQEALGLST
jgi:hypothetical protein